MINTRRSAGFSLLEVLVAFSILALALGVILRIFGGGVSNVATADDYVRASLLAESQLALLGAEQALEEGELEGAFDERFHWRMAVSLYQPDSEAVEAEVIDLETLPIQPFLVQLTVEWEDGGSRRALNLSTLRLAPRDL